MRLFLAFLCVLSVSCGRSEKIAQTDGAVISGRPVSRANLYAKTVVSLYYFSSRTLCTGVLIDDSIILSAAHCGYNQYGDRDENPLICFSQDSLSGPKLEKTLENCLQATRTIHHENYFDGFQEGDKDIADIRLIYFSHKPRHFYFSANLPSAKNSVNFEGQFSVYGFGLIQMNPEKSIPRLQTAKVTLRRAFGKTEFYFPVLKDGRSACHGDSGGPLFETTFSGPKLIGIVSRANSNEGGQTCAEGFIATDVRPYLKWIKSTSVILKQTP